MHVNLASGLVHVIEHPHLHLGAPSYLAYTLFHPDNVSRGRGESKGPDRLPTSSVIFCTSPEQRQKHRRTSARHNMAQPVIQRPPSQNSGSDGRGIEEEDALLTGQSTGKQAPSAQVDSKRWREIGLFVWALVATAVVVVLAVVFQHNAQTSHSGQSDTDGSTGNKYTGKRNLIFMVSDGMGPTSLALTRSWRQHTEQLPWSDTLILDDHLIGQSRTRSASSLITDSAAGATAFSCGLKSYNGAISVTPDFEPCGSVMEAAKRMGYTTGLVVTTRITDATPAVFASHVRRREMEDDIALQMVGEGPLGRSVDLMIGGGRCHFLPNTTGGGCRADGIDVIKQVRMTGRRIVLKSC